jgi:hypothetical protein
MPEDQGSGKRDHIAEHVIFWSGLGIFSTSLAVLAATAYLKPGNFEQIAATVFNTLIPLFGTWVGTVLAFYFSSKNFADATDKTRDLVSQLSDDRLRKIAIKDAWIPVGAIEAVTIGPGQTETNIPFGDIRSKLSSRVTRVPIWDQNKVVRYVIHESMIYKYLAEAAAQANPTLQTFLNHDNMQAIVTKIGWIPLDSTLAVAKAKMESIPDCQDVFVTHLGQGTEPVLGWITNTEIASKSKA